MSDIVLFESADQAIKLNVGFDGETVWLTQQQISELFGKDRSVITRHVNNIFKQGELDKESNVHFLHIPSSDRPISAYSLDVIRYCADTQTGCNFRRTAVGGRARFGMDRRERVAPI